MRKLAIIAVLVAVGIIISDAAVTNDEPPVYMKPKIMTVKPLGFVPPIPSQRPERIYLVSGAATNSAYTTALRGHVMAGISGCLDYANQTDRTVNPSAFYLIPENGWQLFDTYTTAFPFWNGQAYSNLPPAVANETGGRTVVPVILREEVNKYWCRISSSSTNISQAFFNVATNSQGQEIRFNLQYPAVHFGGNGVLESFPDPTTGQWTQVGDDKVFTNGESPSTNAYHIAFRFGATIQNYAQSPAGFDGVKGEFATAGQWLKAELVRRDGSTDTVVDTYIVASPQPRLSIVRSGGGVNITVDEGQKMLVYVIESVDSLSNSSWTQISSDKFALGRPVPVPMSGDQMYFRAKAVTGAP